MANKASALEFTTMTDQGSLLAALGVRSDVPQLTYIYQYLHALGITTVVVEPAYFDRDYLQEFSAFYSLSARGYPNYCKRAHFFNEPVDRQLIISAAGRSAESAARLQKAYRGFTVIRPIESAPFGRTVLPWYPDKYEDINPRIVTPSRDYECHLCGITLTVFGLAWQQQDQGVSACATIGLWTMLHSSAFSERYAIPTTVAITQAAHKNLSLGYRTFPSHHLAPEQVCEAVKEFGLSPYLVEGDEEMPAQNSNYDKPFSKDRFCNIIASLVRSGFPCTIIGEVIRQGETTRGGHMNVCVGYRSQPSLRHDQVFADEDLLALYIHDDNIGPAVRFTVKNYDTGEAKITDNPNHPICLVPDNPQDGSNEAAGDYGFFIPGTILVAVENDLRTSADSLILMAGELRQLVVDVASVDAKKRSVAIPTITVGMQYATAAEFSMEMLKERLSDNPAILARARMDLVEKVGPVSLYVGVVRIGDENGAIVDVLCDTTDNDNIHPVFASVCYDPKYAGFLSIINKENSDVFGAIIDGYSKA